MAKQIKGNDKIKLFAKKNSRTRYCIVEAGEKIMTRRTAGANRVNYGEFEIVVGVTNGAVTKRIMADCVIPKMTEAGIVGFIDDNWSRVVDAVVETSDDVITKLCEHQGNYEKIEKIFQEVADENPDVDIYCRNYKFADRNIDMVKRSRRALKQLPSDFNHDTGVIVNNMTYNMYPLQDDFDASCKEHNIVTIDTAFADIIVINDKTFKSHLKTIKANVKTLEAIGFVVRVMTVDEFIEEYPPADKSVAIGSTRILDELDDDDD